MKIYIDSDFKCHTTSRDGIFREVETDCFNGKCAAFIEGFRFVPFGESWTRQDGVVFNGRTSFPWKDYDELDSAQREYERQLIAEYEEVIKDSTITSSQLDAIDAQVTYTAMMTDTLLEV